MPSRAHQAAVEAYRARSYCSVCSKQFTSPEQRQEHERGKWHRLRASGELQQYLSDTNWPGKQGGRHGGRGGRGGSGGRGRGWGGSRGGGGGRATSHGGMGHGRGRGRWS